MSVPGFFKSCHNGSCIFPSLLRHLATKKVFNYSTSSSSQVWPQKNEGTETERGSNEADFLLLPLFFASKTFNQEMFDWKLMISWADRNMVFGGKCGFMKKFDRDGI